MNLPYAYSLLLATTEQRHGFIKLVGMRADHEVRQMAEAGLVEATFNDGAIGSFTSINRVLQAGEMFLRTFENVHLPKECPRIAAVAEKWAVKFSLDLHDPKPMA
jgi:hypothetical protein